MTRQQVDDQVLAYDAIPSAWPGLSFDDRQDVIDTLYTYDLDLAFKYLLGSATLDPALAGRIRSRVSALTGTESADA